MSADEFTDTADENISSTDTAQAKESISMEDFETKFPNLLQEFLSVADYKEVQDSLNEWGIAADIDLQTRTVFKLLESLTDVNKTEIQRILNLLPTLYEFECISSDGFLEWVKY